MMGKLGLITRCLCVLALEVEEDLKRFLTGVLAAATVWVGSGLAAGASPLFEPDSTWTTLETPHFRIYYTEKLAHKAKQIAAIAEDAHKLLVPYMEVEPGGPTEVIISDGYDELNSLAHSSPHRAVWLWQTPPNPDEGMYIGRYDQWMRLLFIHEYTHILQFEHMPWLVNQANTALGGLLLSGMPTLPIEITLNLPDLLSNPPSFFTEGLAVYTESTFTPGGRGREGDFDMTRRMAFLDGKVPTLDQIWGRYLLDWPMGGYEYTWGTGFIQYMVKTYGPDAPIKVMKAYSTLPWLGFDVACQRALGVKTEAIWEGMKAELASRYQAEYQAYLDRKKVASTSGAPWRMAEPKDVTTTGRYHRHPFWSADGTLYYAEALKNKSPRLWADKLDGSERTSVMGKSTRSAANLTPEGDAIIYETDTQDTVKQLNSFRDLFIYDLKTKTPKRLTHQARTFAPALSKDGKRIAAVTSGEGKSGIAIFDREGKLQKKWSYDNNDYQFGNPAWSPDGKTLAVAVWQGGTRDIWLMDAESGELEALWKDEGVDFYPSWTPDGAGLVFSSDRTGIFNLYAYDLKTRKITQLTDVLGGAFDPAVSPDGKTIAFANYTSRGYDIQTLEFRPALAKLVKAVEAQPLKLPDVSGSLPEVTPLKVGGYNPLWTFLPSTWFPVLGEDERGANMTLYSFWQDVLREHALTLIGGYGLNSGRVNYGFRYENNQTLPQWIVSLNEYPSPGRYPIDQNNWANLWQWNKSMSLAFSYPGLRNPMFDPPPISGDNWTGGVRTEMVEDYALQPDSDKNQVFPANAHQDFPTAQNEGLVNSVFVQWQRANMFKLPYDYGPMNGQMTTLGLEQGIPGLGLGGTQAFTRLWADHRFFQPVPWAEKHSIGVRTTAGALYGRNGEFYYSIWRQPFGYQPLSTINRWDLTSATSYDNRYVMLRGYSFLLGNRNATLGLEYRFPIADVFRGWGGAPLFVQRLYGVGFLDSGFFWGLDPNELLLPSLADFKSGAGFELRAQTTMFQAVPIDLRLGLARGLTAGGEWQLNYGLGTTF